MKRVTTLSTVVDGEHPALSGESFLRELRDLMFVYIGAPALSADTSVTTREV